MSNPTVTPSPSSGSVLDQALQAHAQGDGFDQLDAQQAQPQTLPTASATPSSGSVLDQALANPQDAHPTQNQPNADKGFLSGLWGATGKPIATLSGQLFDYYRQRAEAEQQRSFGRQTLDAVVNGMTGPLEILKDAATDENHPLRQVVTGIYEAHKATAYKAAVALQHAIDAHRAGNDSEMRRALSEYVGYTGATGLPALGPAAAQAGEDIGAGKTGEGLGEGTGLVASVLAPRVIGKVAPKVVGAASKVVKATGAVPEVVEQIAKGERVAQPEAEAALRRAATTGSREAGQATVQPQSLRAVLEDPIDSLESQTKVQYREIDRAAGTDFKALNDKLSNTEYQIRQLTETEEDVAKEAQLEKSRTAIMDKIEAAKQQAIAKGVDPDILDKADANFRQANALKDVEARVFKNTGVVKGNVVHGTPETVNVDAAVKALQKLQDSEPYGSSRLEQAFGREGAKAVLDDMYSAQRAGVKALTRQQWATRVAKLGLTVGGLTLGGHILHAVLAE
jgi:DNA-binding transcriptional regulator YdaS (Cro superfamily)